MKSCAPNKGKFVRSREATINKFAFQNRDVCRRKIHTSTRVDDVFCSSSRQDTRSSLRIESRSAISSKHGKKKRLYGFNADGIHGLTGLLVRRECRARIKRDCTWPISGAKPVRVYTWTDARVTGMWQEKGKIARCCLLLFFFFLHICIHAECAFFLIKKMHADVMMVDWKRSGIKTRLHIPLRFSLRWRVIYADFISLVIAYSRPFGICRRLLNWIERSSPTSSNFCVISFLV